MKLPEFLKPNGAKIMYFLFMLAVAPFPYFIFSETLGQYEIEWVWGFPPLISLIYDYLPSSLQEINAGILEISKIKTIYFYIPSYAFFIFLLSCAIGLIVEKIRMRYGITAFRGLLWRKIEKIETKPFKKVKLPKKVEKPKEKPKEEIKPEEEKEEIELEELEEVGEGKITEMSTLIREEETFLREQKEKLQRYLDEMNVKKLKSIGVDVKENKIICSGCKQWIQLRKGGLMKLIERHGFDVIWEYKCPDCKRKK